MNGFFKKMKRKRKNMASIGVIFSVVTVVVILFCFDVIDLKVHSVDNDSIVPVKAPVYSYSGGFYDEDFYLVLSAEKECKIYYSLDGSNPTEASTLYEAPIHIYDRSDEPNVYRSISHVIVDYNEKWSEPDPVDKCLVVRSIAVDRYGNCSDIATQSYFIGLNEYRDRLVLSLTADPEDLFGENGIYVTGSEYDEIYEATGDGSQKKLTNYNQKGSKWERKGNAELFDADNTVFNQFVGLRIQGHGSRESALKRFSICAKTAEGLDSFFDTDRYGYNVNSLFTRNGFKHYVVQKLAEGRNVLVMKGEPVTVFLNGELWSSSEWYLYEKMTEENLSERLGNTIAVVKNGDSSDADQKGINSYYTIYKYVESHDLSDENNYAEFCKIIDPQSYIDQACFITYLANLDIKEKWNNYIWHSVAATDDELCDSRWRWGFYDMDLAHAYLDSDFSDLELECYQLDLFTMYGTYQGKKTFSEWTLFAALSSNDEFCKQFVLTYMDLINTVFQKDNYEPIIAEASGKDSSKQAFLEFLDNRSPYAIEYLAREFELESEPQTLTLTINDSGAGKVRLNTIEPEFENNIWSGDYFTEYPVSLSATSNDGYLLKRILNPHLRWGNRRSRSVA